MVEFHQQAARNYIMGTPKLKAIFEELGQFFDSTTDPDKYGKRRVRHIFYHEILPSEWHSERYKEKLRLQPKQHYQQDVDVVMQMIESIGWIRFTKALFTIFNNRYAYAVKMGFNYKVIETLSKTMDAIKRLPKDTGM